MAVPAIPCVTVVSGDQSLAITFPGGATVSVQVPSPKIPSPLEVSRALMGQVNAALAPLQPIFAVFTAIDAVPDLLTNPTKLINAIADLAAMLPQVSVPIMVGKVIDLLISYLQGVQGQLQALITALASIAAATTRASTLGNARLLVVVGCATNQIAAQMQALNDGAGPLNDMIAVVNALLGLVPGAPTIPSLSNLGSDPEAALAPLADAIAALQAIRSAFPL